MLATMSKRELVKLLKEYLIDGRNRYEEKKEEVESKKREEARKKELEWMKEEDLRSLKRVLEENEERLRKLEQERQRMRREYGL